MDTGGSPEDLLNQLRRRLAQLRLPRQCALAVSGGRDSIALLHLCATLSKELHTEFFAFTVDHALRPEAKEEAAQVSRWANALRIPHETLAWEGRKPKAGIQAAARNARYALLIRAAQNKGCDAILTAHTLDDQAETVFMRLSRGAGVRGLSAMQPETMIASGASAPIRLLRPLLSIRRQMITDYQSHVGQAFIDDPSNDDPAFERVRTRALLAATEEQGILGGCALANAAAQLADADKKIARQEARLFRDLRGCFHPWGGVSVHGWPAQDVASSGLARRLIYAVGGGEFAPDEPRAEAAVSEALSVGAATLGGALIRKWRGNLWFLREPSALLGRAGVKPSDPAPLNKALLWDRRFILTPAKGISDMTVAPTGIACPALNQDPRMGQFYGPEEGVAAAPAIFADGELIAAPAFPFMQNAQISAQNLIQERFVGEIIRFS